MKKSTNKNRAEAALKDKPKEGKLKNFFRENSKIFLGVIIGVLIMSVGLALSAGISALNKNKKSSNQQVSLNNSNNKTINNSSQENPDSKQEPGSGSTNANGTTSSSSNSSSSTPATPTQSPSEAPAPQASPAYLETCFKTSPSPREYCPYTPPTSWSSDFLKYPCMKAGVGEVACPSYYDLRIIEGNYHGQCYFYFYTDKVQRLVFTPDTGEVSTNCLTAYPL